MLANKILDGTKPPYWRLACERSNPQPVQELIGTESIFTEPQMVAHHQVTSLGIKSRPVNPLNDPRPDLARILG